MAVNRRRLLILVLLAALLTGCWDRMEIEDQAFVTALGLDQGRAGKIMVSARVALVGGMAPGLPGAIGAQPGSLASALLTAEAGSITQAVHILNGSLPRRLSLVHLQAILVGESLARSGLEPLLMEMLRSPVGRGTVGLIQVRGRAFDALAANRPFTEINPAKMAEGYLWQAKQLHLAAPARLHHFLLRLAAPGGDPFLPAVGLNPGIRPDPQEPQAGPPSALPGELPRGGGNPLEQVGTAIFRRDRLAGFLNVDETQMLLALRGEMGKAYVTFPDPTVPAQTVTLRFHQENLPDYTAAFRGTRPEVRIRLLFEGEVLAIPGGVDYVRSEARAQLEQAAGRYAEETLRGLLAKLQQWEADPVGLGHLFRGQFPTWKQWLAYHWPDHVRDLQVDVSVAMRIRRYGLYTGPDRIKSGE